jgi:hypothetical protein
VTATLLPSPFFFFPLGAAQQRRQWQQSCHCLLHFVFLQRGEEGDGSVAAIALFYFFCCSKEKKATKTLSPSSSSLLLQCKVRR